MTVRSCKVARPASRRRLVRSTAVRLARPRAPRSGPTWRRASRLPTTGPRPTTLAEAGTDPAPPPVDPAPTGIARHLPALASPVYRRFIVAAFVGSIGNWMQTTAQGWLVLGLTDSRFALGATSAAATAPILLLSILAGVLADRVDLRRLLVAAQLAAAGIAAVLAILTMTRVVEFWHVLVLAFLS